MLSTKLIDVSDNTIDPYYVREHRSSEVEANFINEMERDIRVFGVADRRDAGGRDKSNE